MDRMTPEQRSRNMSSVKSKDTKAEVILRKALWHKGLRYWKNYKKLPGKPDIALQKYHIAIFVDGDFWHARGHLEHPGEEVQSHKAFWQKKLEYNVARDKEVNNLLAEQGWLVLRFWEKDVKKDLEQCVEKVLCYIPTVD